MVRIGFVDIDFATPLQLPMAGEHNRKSGRLNGDTNMGGALECNLQNVNELPTCAQCGRTSGEGWSFQFKEPTSNGAEDGGIAIKCSRCAIRHRPMLWRSLIVALVVGTILTLLNQGDVLFAGSWKSPLCWKIPLTYCVPFCVATYGALSNGRR